MQDLKHRLSQSTIRKIRRRVKQGEYVPVKTGFVTEDGPAVGTVWVFAAHPQAAPFTVEHVEPVKGRGEFPKTTLVGGGTMPTCEFVNMVESGSIILVGVTTINSHFEF